MIEGVRRYVMVINDDSGQNTLWTLQGNDCQCALVKPGTNARQAYVRVTSRDDAFSPLIGIGRGGIIMQSKALSAGYIDVLSIGP